MMSWRPTDAPSIQLPSRVDGDIVVLPREISQDGTGLYHDSVLTLAKALRNEGAAADYQHDAEHRNWIGEKSAAALALAFIVGVASNAGWAALVRLFASRGDEHVKGTIGRVTRSGNETTWDFIEVEGSGEEVAAALRDLGWPIDS
jgi:hypothetical protein